MLMVMEIVLTILAWKKGWGWKALIPVGIVFGLAFFAALTIAASGGTVTNKGAFLIGDILLVITQAVLSSKAPRQEKAQEMLAPDAHPESA